MERIWRIRYYLNQHDHSNTSISNQTIQSDTHPPNDHTVGSDCGWMALNPSDFGLPGHNNLWWWVNAFLSLLHHQLPQHLQEHRQWVRTPSNDSTSRNPMGHQTPWPRQTLSFFLLQHQDLLEHQRQLSRDILLATPFTHLQHRCQWRWRNRRCWSFGWEGRSLSQEWLHLYSPPNPNWCKQ